MKLTLLALASALLLQAGSSPRELLNLQRPLTAAEITTVVDGIRQALTGKTLRLVDQSRWSPEFLMGADGLPRLVRVKGTGESISGITSEAGTIRVFNLPNVIVSVFEHSRAPARRCAGGPSAAGMVVEYVMNLTTGARQVSAREPGRRDAWMAHPLQMLREEEALITGESRIVAKRPARALKAPRPTEAVLVTGDPAPDRAEFIPVQTLWIDTQSLLPLRYEVYQRQAFLGATDFVYEQIDLERPAGFDVPTCVP